MIQPPDRILWLDCVGGLAVGCLVIGFYPAVSGIGGLPAGVVIALGAGNLGYGAYSLFVATRRPRPKRLVGALAAANVAWFFVCVGVLGVWWSEVSGLGLMHLLGEGVYVAVLGVAEWRVRDRLAPGG